MKMLPLILLAAALNAGAPVLAVAQTNPPATLSGTNVAGGKPASQISTGWGGIASRAVDGNTDGVYDDGSVTHTDAAPGAWWEVNLQQDATIQWIRIYNRSDCCTARLSNFTVQILDGNRAVVKQFITNGEAARESTYWVGGSVGRYVRVALNGNDNLSLAEVQVWD